MDNIKIVVTDLNIIYWILLFLLLCWIIVSSIPSIIRARRYSKCNHTFIQHDRCFICHNCGKKVKINV